MNNIKIINISFRIIMIIATIFLIWNLMTLGITFCFATDGREWSTTYGSLISATSIILAAFVAALTGAKAIIENKELEDHRKQELIYIQRLYFISTMKGISTSSDQYSHLLQSYLKEYQGKDVTDIPLSENMKFNLLEMINTYNDYIKILNKENLPSTLKHIKNDFILAIQNLLVLKNELYKIKPRLQELSTVALIEDEDFTLIIENIKNISKNASKLQKEDVKGT